MKLNFSCISSQRCSLYEPTSLTLCYIANLIQFYLTSLVQSKFAATSHMSDRTFWSTLPHHICLTRKFDPRCHSTWLTRHFDPRCHITNVWPDILIHVATSHVWPDILIHIETSHMGDLTFWSASALENTTSIWSDISLCVSHVDITSSSVSSRTVTAWHPCWHSVGIRESR